MLHCIPRVYCYLLSVLKHCSISTDIVEPDRYVIVPIWRISVVDTKSKNNPPPRSGSFTLYLTLKYCVSIYNLSADVVSLEGLTPGGSFSYVHRLNDLLGLDRQTGNICKETKSMLLILRSLLFIISSFFTISY